MGPKGKEAIQSHDRRTAAKGYLVRFAKRRSREKEKRSREGGSPKKEVFCRTSRGQCIRQLRVQSKFGKSYHGGGI